MSSIFGTEDPAVIEELWPIAAAGTFALIGAWLGKFWEHRGGHAAWLNDQRLEAYVNFVDASETLSRAAYERYRSPDAESHAERLGALNDALSSVRRWDAQITILGPAEAAAAASGVVDVLLDLGDAVEDWADDLANPFDDLGERLNGVNREFLNAIRRVVT